MARRSSDQPFRDGGELRSVLEDLLAELNRDEKLSTVLGAARWRQSFEFTDLDLRLDVAPDPEGPGTLRWTFDRDPDWEPKLTLKMSSADAHEYLRGELSLPVAIARGKVKVEGDGPSRLKYATLMALLSVPYQRVAAKHMAGRDSAKKGCDGG